MVIVKVQMVKCVFERVKLFWELSVECGGIVEVCYEKYKSQKKDDVINGKRMDGVEK